MKAEKELESYGMKISQSKDDDRSPIDFALQDKDTDEEYATVWGDLSDVDWECNHPYELIEWEDDDERGECKLCGATCAWSWVPDGVEPTTGKLMKSREPYEWEPIRYPKGLLGDYIKELRGIC